MFLLILYAIQAAYTMTSTLIPPTLRDKVLPRPTISVISLLRFSLPTIAAAVGDVDTPQFICTQQPATTDDPSIICKIPTPGPDSVRKLVEEVHRFTESNVPDIEVSIAPIHVPHKKRLQLPLWIVTYWMEVIRLRTKDGAYARWLQAEEWLHQRRQAWHPSVPKTTHRLVDQALTALATLPYSCPLSGFSNAELTSSLVTYTSHAWLSDVHENQLLDMLRTNLLRRPKDLFVVVGNTYIWKHFESAFRAQDLSSYRKDRVYARLRGVGRALEAGEQSELGLLINLKNTHWITVVVKYDSAEVLYGDSLGHHPDPHVMEVLNWWIQQHSDRSFEWRALDIARQDNEFSCGILSWNALAHHVLPDMYPLSGSSRHEVDGQRLTVFVDLVQRHLDHVSDINETTRCCTNVWYTQL